MRIQNDHRGYRQVAEGTMYRESTESTGRAQMGQEQHGWDRECPEWTGRDQRKRESIDVLGRIHCLVQGEHRGDWERPEETNKLQRRQGEHGG